MDLNLLKRAHFCFAAVRDSVWLNKALDKFDAMVFSLLDLRMPKDPNKPDVVELERRILYSANPFFVGGDGEIEDPYLDYSDQSNMSPDEWQTFLIEMVGDSKSELLLNMAAEIRAQRGLSTPPAKEADFSPTQLEAQPTVADDVGVSENSDDDNSDDDSGKGNRLENNFYKIERLLESLAVGDTTSLILHGTDGTDRLGVHWSDNGNSYNAPLVSIGREVNSQDAVSDVVLIDLRLNNSVALIDAVNSSSVVFTYDSLTESASSILGRVELWAELSQTDIGSLSVLSHGASGAFELGNQWISLSSLDDMASDWQQLAKHFVQGADIYILGCNVGAANGDGQLLLDQLASLTNADVFASNNVTGVGGDWTLEIASSNSTAPSVRLLSQVFDGEQLQSADVSLAWYNASWNYRQSVTVNESMVTGTSNLSNFAVLVSITDANLKSTGNGGHVGQTDGGDFVFTSSDGTTKLDYQIESYDATTGTILAWVEVPTLSYNVNTSLYLYYGNTAVADQWNNTGTWESIYKGIWHLGSDYLDSSSTASNGTNNGSTNYVTATVGAGDDFNGSSNYISTTSSDAKTANDFTISLWFNADATAFASHLVWEGASSGNGYGSECEMHISLGNINASNTQVSNVLSFFLGTDATQTSTINIATAFTDTAGWHHVAVVVSNMSSSPTATMYLDGTSVGTDTGTTAAIDRSSWNTNMTFGRPGASQRYFDGGLDEIRLATTNRTSDWLLAEYNNQNAPGTYVSLASEEGSPIISSNGGGANTSISVAEDSTSVTTVVATDPGSAVQTLTYSIIGGADFAKFSISSSTGFLTFVAAPNFEAPTDSGANNVYDVIVQVSDGALTDTQSIAVTVTNVNEAPVLADTALSITVAEDAGVPSGVVGSLISSFTDGVSDVDSGAVKGIAITASVETNGTWYYTTTNGTNWTAVGSVSSASSLLLANNANTRLYFAPGTNYNGTSTSALTVRGWDQTSGSAGTRVSTSTNGTTTAFSLATDVVDVTVTAVNDATSIGTEFNGLNAGYYTFVANGQTFTASVTDYDGSKWLLIGRGREGWEFDTDGQGAASEVVQNVGTVAGFAPKAYSDAIINDMLTRAGTDMSNVELRFMRASTTNGTGAYQDVRWRNFTGNSNAFTWNLEDSPYSVTQQQINAPSGLAGAQTGTLSSLSTYDTNNGTFGNDADRIFTWGWSSHNSIKGFSYGQSVAGTNNNSGTSFMWEYTTEDHAIPYTEVYMRLIDPSLAALAYTENDSPKSVMPTIELNDVDNATLQSATVQVTGNYSSSQDVLAFTNTANITASWNSTNGTLTLTGADTVVAYQSALRAITYQNSSDAPSTLTRTVSFSVNDGTTGSAALTRDIAVTAANDAPVLADTALSITLAEDAGAPSGVVGSLVSSFNGGVSDVDSGAIKGIAITASVETNGIWYYTTNNGTNWTAVGSVSSASSLLLADNANTRLYFAPSLNYNGTSTSALTVRGWDQTSSSAGTKVDTSTNGGITAFSSATDVIDVSVTAVNESPIAVTDTATAVEAGGISNGTAGTNPTGNVLANDTDVDSGDTQTVSGVAAGTVGAASGSVASNVTGTYGSINIAANGSYTYTIDSSNATVQALRTAGNIITDVFTYTMQDAGGLASTTQITVTIQGANDTPHDMATTGLTVAENAANTTSVGTITRSDLDASDTPSYSLVDSAGGRFAINSSTGAVIVANGSLLNYETATSHNITVRVTDLAGATYDEVFTVNLTDVDEFDVSAPVDSDATVNALNENSANGTLVGITALSADADATNNVVTYSLFDSDSGRFAVDANTGVVTVAGVLNREALGASRNITVRATSSDGSTANSVFTININDIDEFDAGAVTDSNVTANSVAENAANGTVVGVTAFATDIDATTNLISYSLDDNAGGRFIINGLTGVVTVADGTLLNYEAAISHNIIVRATSADTSSATQSFAILLTDVNESAISAVSDSDAAANTVLENSSNGTTVGLTGLATDADGTDTVSYSLDDDASGRFTINTSTGVVTVAGGLDRETAASYDITIRATSSDTSTTTQTFSINLGDVNEFNVGAVTDSNATANSIAESAATGTIVNITGLTSDADATTNTISYSLFDSDGGNFAIDTNTGIVTTATMFNREALGASRNITIRATSADTSFTDQVFSIAVIDVDEFAVTTPTDVNATANAVDENVSIGTLVGITASASDADATTNTITYSLFDSDAGNFAIDANTGIVTTAAMFNREALGASRNITVRATSSDGSTANSVFTININDIDEFDAGAVTDSNVTANSVAENAANGTVVGVTAFATDIDATTNLISYSLDDNAGGRFTINSSTGVVTVADGTPLNYEAATSHNIIVRATSADTSSATQSFTILLTDVNESAISAVSDSDAAANTVLENSSNGTTVGLTGLATDADGTDTVTYSLDDDASGRFTINTSTGVVTVAGGLDRETVASYDITIRATSSDTSTTTQTFSINLGDVDEFDTGSVTDSNATANSVVENVANGTVVNIAGLAADVDATTNTIAYSLFDNDGGNFAIDANTGVVTTAAMFNREALGASRNITIRATSADSSFTDQGFSIAIVDVDEFDVTTPSDVNTTTNAVDENVSIGTLVGITASASDADATTNTITYSLFDSDAGNFAIDANTGIVTTAAMFNREALGASRNITVRATSSDGSTANSVFTININDIDEFDAGAVTDSNVTANSVAENAANGTVVGVTAFATDIDATTNLISYSLDDNAGGRFIINGLTGVVTVADGTLLNYEAATSHNIIVRATSADASSATQSFTINLTDVNESAISAVSDSNAAANTVLENSANGMTVGLTGLATDADGTDTVTYSLDDDASGRFAIDPNTGVVTVAGGIDREADGQSRSITIRATSADGSFTDGFFLINIYDDDEFDVGPISDLDLSQDSVAENSAAGTIVHYRSFAFDGDTSDNGVVYSLDDNAGGRFSIDTNSGILTVADGSGLNYEANSTHSIIVRALSDDGSTSVATVGIAVLDVAERPIGFNDYYLTNNIDVLRLLGAGVLLNDIDPDGDVLSIQILSGPSNGDQSGSESDETSTSTGNLVAAVNPVDESFLLDSIPVAAPASLEASGTEHRNESSGIGLAEARVSSRVEGLKATWSRRVTRLHVEQWTSKTEYEETENLKRREESVWQIMSDERNDREGLSDQSLDTLNMEAVVTTVLGTGAVLWMIKATQFAATFIATSAPTWIQVDNGSTLDGLAKEKNASEEASEKLFE